MYKKILKKKKRFYNQTLKSLNLNLKIILLNNGGYLSIMSTHKNFLKSVFGSDPKQFLDLV